MKKILLLTLFLLFATVSSSFAVSSFEDSRITDLPGIGAASLAWGDYDNDGYLDLAMLGWKDFTDGYITKIYHNNGDSTFTDIEAGLTGVDYGSLAWGDYDNDGYLDLAVCGYINSGVYITKIYHNNGDNTFTEIEAGLPGVAYSSLAWGDYDNDGDLDLAVCGFTNSGRITKIYHNNGDNTFTDIGASLTNVYCGSLAWGDYDNDGDLDLAVCGDTGSTDGDITKIYRNDGAGIFTDIGTNLTGVYCGFLAWGDYDNDGYLDLAVCGQVSDVYITKIYHNNGDNTFTDIEAGLTGIAYGSGSPLAWGDYDNDGDLDLAISGDTGGMEVTPITKIYRNDGNDIFTGIEADLTNVYNGSLAWGDYDNDGDLDLAVCGDIGSTEMITKIYKNLEISLSEGNQSNTTPLPPTNLTYESGSTILKWNPGSDSETPDSGLYYNLRLGITSGGNEIVSGVYGSPLLGNYLRPKLSASQLGVRLSDLPSGTYYWSVQTIDTGLRASLWSYEETFLVGSSNPPINNGGDDDSAFYFLGSKCFIATACYGTPMAEEVRVLSKFRDECLLTNPVGAIFVKTYYKASPPVADFISKHPVLKNMVRSALKPLIWLAKEVEN